MSKGLPFLREEGKGFDKPERNQGLAAPVANRPPLRHSPAMPAPDTDTVTFTAPLLVWRTEQYGDMGYVVIEGDPAEAVTAHELTRRLELGRRRGFGSVKVNAEVGDSRWSTSVFPQKAGTWFLPVKKPICRAEDLAAGDAVTVRLELL